MKKVLSLFCLSAFSIYPIYGSGGIEAQSMANPNPAPNNAAAAPANDTAEKQNLRNDLHNQFMSRNFTYSQKYEDIYANKKPQLQSFNNSLDKLVELADPDPEKKLGIFRVFSQQLIDYILKNETLNLYRRTGKTQDPQNEAFFFVNMVKDLLAKLTYKAALGADPLKSLPQEQKLQLFKFIYTFSSQNPTNSTIVAKSFFLDTENRIADRLKVEYLGWAQAQKKTQDQQTSPQVLKQQVQEIKSTDPKGWLKEKLYWTFQQIDAYKKIVNDYEEAQQKIATSKDANLAKQQEAAYLKNAKYIQFSNIMKVLLDNAPDEKEKIDKKLGIANVFTSKLSNLIMDRLKQLGNTPSPKLKLDLTYQTNGDKAVLDGDTKALIDALKAIMGTMEIKYPPTPKIKRLGEFLYVFSFLNPQNAPTQNLPKDTRQSFFQSIEDKFTEELPRELRLNYWKDEAKGLNLRAKVTESQDPLVATITHEIPTEEYFENNLYKIILLLDQKEQDITFYTALSLMAILNEDFAQTLAIACADESIDGTQGIAHRTLYYVDGRCSSGRRSYNPLQPIVWSGIQQARRVSTKTFLETLRNRYIYRSQKAAQSLQANKQKRDRSLQEVLKDDNVLMRATIDGLEKIWLAWQGMVYFHVIDLPLPLESLIGKGTLGLKEFLSAKFPWKYAGTWPEYYLAQPTFTAELLLRKGRAQTVLEGGKETTSYYMDLKTDQELREEIENAVRPKLPYFELSLSTIPDKSFAPDLSIYLIKTQARIMSFFQSFRRNMAKRYAQRAALFKNDEAGQQAVQDLALTIRRQVALISLYSGILSRENQDPDPLNAQETEMNKILLEGYQKGEFSKVSQIAPRTFLATIDKLKREIALYEGSKGPQAKSVSDILKAEFVAQLGDIGNEIFQNIENDLAKLRTEVFPEQAALVQKTDQAPSISAVAQQTAEISPPAEQVPEISQQQKALEQVAQQSDEEKKKIALRQGAMRQSVKDGLQQGKETIKQQEALSAATQQAAQIAEQQKALQEFENQKKAIDQRNQAIRRNFEEGLSKANEIAKQQEANNRALKPLPQEIEVGH